MKNDISMVLALCMIAAIILTVGAFAIGYRWGRDDGRFTEHCHNLGGEVLRDGECGNEKVTHIDAGPR